MSEQKMYLTTNWSKERGDFLAVISYGQPQLGDENITVLDVNTFPSRRECRSWFRRMKKERPWETRQ